MTYFLQLVVTGFSLGIVYALVAIGFVIILKCSEVFNIAQGHFVLIGGYLGYTFLVAFHLPIWACLLMAMATAAVMGLLIERLTLRPLVGQPVLAVIMMTIALASILEGLATLIWGGEYKTYHGLLPTLSLHIGEISVPSESLIGLIVSGAAVTILMLFFHYTKIGLAMRATAEDLQVVQSAGIKATRVYALSWVIASVVGVIGGILLGGVSGVMIPLANVGIKAFAVVLLGGLESIGGAIVAGIILGILENVAAGYLDPLLPGGGLANVFPFIVMIVVLIFKPHGLFGQVRIERI
ncbi:MAG: branched-chain amino acid ABC transporter permease [Deltaproteobacteria bacterium]|nr:branched-chain amino acid ABC transporter permease [Deltaproteobacteria bacterium]MBW1919009.1 branched-chain amino acid ABC transporter permease [Deltaproteobacteria bacterium]MBW1934382.1 branched-chain amino acid ABC transporter permease [Deltaproteobacteria bacterium]MBW1976525.1 branched-chain amino acid ABC transporter permease [Deltaproteobacteria bacterium]MBW2043778.1 branched-chain amino acid ABC transporter permease [Deltaproteobacteria bacterium]